ncbi:MAG: methyltransferase domain-containing protein [Limisphaerales bacterium]
MSTNWEAQYQANDTPWDKGEASPGLVDWLAAHPDWPRGSVLVPGCGLGHDVRAWAAAGFLATGLDIAPSAVERAQAAGLPERTEFRLGDFLADEPSDQFDWVFEHTCFCAIQPDRRDDYVRAVLRWLKPVGHYLAVNYFIPDKEGPPFGVGREEIWAHFSPHFELLEEWTPRSYPNRTGLERMFLWRRG